MGGVEDDEPPSKRVKHSSGEARGLSKIISFREHTSCSSYSMARPLASQGDDEVVGPKGVVKKVELVRIVGEALYSLGYKTTGVCLEEESGIPLHSTVVTLFMQQIIDGKWDESVATLHNIGLIDIAIIKLATLVILEQKFFELLYGEKLMEALKTLRTEIAPLCNNDDRVRELSIFFISPSQNTLNGASGQESRLKSRKNLLEELQNLLPSTLMVPENRLVNLVEQALDLQKDACRFHNSSILEGSLLTNHQCGREQIPSQTLQILKEHTAEVWFLQFSHNGKYLASSSSDCLVIIWEDYYMLANHLMLGSVNLLQLVQVQATGRVSVIQRLSGHKKPVSHISWSPDDLQLLTCGVEEAVGLWDIPSCQRLHVYEISGLGMVSCGWFPDGKIIYTGVSDKTISMWDLEGNNVNYWIGKKTIRTADLEITSNGKELITVYKENMILLLTWESMSTKFIKEDQTIISFSSSEDSKFLLVSLLNQELHLWKIDGCPKLVAKYKGRKCSRFVVRSCFGGLEQAFIASGSEDSQVYVWHRVSGDLIFALAGHSGVVNCVSWNPANPRMLASASDDHTIRIWGLNQVDLYSSGES
ncbi:hypothetical protein Pfo_014335 [Paulownia fortunei]|nr:hypothetical protein Pfo_014335 [Paulownia fortunei]